MLQEKNCYRNLNRKQKLKNPKSKHQKLINNIKFIFCISLGFLGMFLTFHDFDSFLFSAFLFLSMLALEYII